jgi:hypothetical protein
MKNTVIVVGLGKIGMLYSNNKKIYNNHSDLFYNSKKFKLLAGVDKNKKKILKFKKKYSLTAYFNLAKAYLELKPEIIVISVDTKSMPEIYNQIIKKKIKPKYFILEKPGSFNYENLKRIYLYCKKNNINLIMNYQRNFSNLNSKIKNEIFHYKTSRVLVQLDVIYNKGFYNSCSHYLNFLLSIIDKSYFQKIKIKERYKMSSVYDLFFDFSFNSKILINFVYKKNQDEKIVFHFNDNFKIVYVTEKKIVYTLNNKKRKKIESDINYCQQNLLKQFNQNKIKQNYFIKNSLLTLNLLNKIKDSLFNFKKMQ